MRDCVADRSVTRLKLDPLCVPELQCGPLCGMLVNDLQPTRPLPHEMPSRYHLALTKRAVGVALVSALAALLGLLSPSLQELHPPPTHASLFPAELLDHSPLLDRVFGAASDGVGGGEPRYSFGRWRAPATNVTFHSDAPGFSAWKTDTFRTKWWHYSSVNTRDYFIGMAVVKVRELRKLGGGGVANLPDSIAWLRERRVPVRRGQDYARRRQVRVFGQVATLSLLLSSLLGVCW